MTTDAQRQLHQALKTHTSDLEIERGAALDYDLDDRIEAARQLLKWLEHALETPTFRQAQPEPVRLMRTRSAKTFGAERQGAAWR
jgi:antitoxin component HigA of HigAB toxin-antitoxin module